MDGRSEGWVGGVKVGGRSEGWVRGVKGGWEE